MLQGLKGCRYICSHIMINICRIKLLTCLHQFSPKKILMDLKKPGTALQYLCHLSNLVLVIAVGLGLYARWMHSEDVAVLLIAFLGILVFTASCTLVYYFSMQNIGYCLSSLWIGCLLGVVSFTTEHSMTEHERVKTILEVMDILFISSLVFRCFWSLLERFVPSYNKQPTMINTMDCMEMVGMAIASIVTGKDFVTISLLILSLSLANMTLRLKSFLGFIDLVALITVATFILFPKVLQMPANPYALSCFLGRVTFEPFIDIFLSHLDLFQRWESLTSKSSFVRRLVILGLLTVQITFFVFCAKQIPGHKEWFVVVPMFGAFSLLWFMFHLVFIIIVWQLSNKITECNATYNSLSEENRNMKRIMESKGVRHFALISQRMAFVTLITTIVMGGLNWTTKTGPSLCLWFINIPLEITVISLLWELSNLLGGTCVGTAIVCPSAYAFNRPKRTDASIEILPPDLLQELGSRATRTLNKIQQFFGYNMIDIYGCDYSSNGLSLEALESKVKAFMQRCTSDGPRYDTYLLYYTGPVYNNGDWALLGEERLTFATLYEWWQQCDRGFGTRLILILDTEHSYMWIREILPLKRDFIALQSIMVNRQLDPEDYPGVYVGDFTSDWTEYNTVNLKGTNWRDRKRVLRPVYGLSQAMPHFVFHLPTQEDIAHYWDASFPKITKPLIRVTNFPQVSKLLCVCYCMSACLRRCKMLFLAPRQFDTGHGFKLVR